MSDDLQDIPCRDIVEIVTSYLEDELDEPTRSSLEAHLATCPSCALYVEQMRTTITLSGAAGEPQQLSPELREGLRRAFDGWARAGSGG